MRENAREKLRPAERIGEGEVALRRGVVELPDELVREGAVVVLLDLSVEPPHPADPDEETREVAPRLLLPDPALHAVPEAAAAVGPPQPVDGSEVVGRYELHLREEDVPALLRGLARQGDEQAPRLVVGPAEVARREVVGEEV